MLRWVFLWKYCSLPFDLQNSAASLLQHIYIAVKVRREIKFCLTEHTWTEQLKIWRHFWKWELTNTICVVRGSDRMASQMQIEARNKWDSRGKDAFSGTVSVWGGRFAWALWNNPSLITTRRVFWVISLYCSIHHSLDNVFRCYMVLFTWTWSDYCLFIPRLWALLRERPLALSTTLWLQHLPPVL